MRIAEVIKIIFVSWVWATISFFILLYIQNNDKGGKK